MTFTGLLGAFSGLFDGISDPTPSAEPIAAPSPSYEWHNAFGTATDYQVPAESCSIDPFGSDPFNH